MSTLSFTIPEKDTLQGLMERAVRAFLSENELYKTVIFDVMKSYPADYGIPAKKVSDEQYCIQRLAQMVNVSKLEGQLRQYITKEYSFMAQDYGEEFPEEVTLDVYTTLAKGAAF